MLHRFVHGGENTLYVVAISAATPSDARGIQAMYWLRNIRAGLEEHLRGQVVIVITHKDLVDQATVDENIIIHDTNKMDNK